MPHAIRMPPENELPRGPVRDFVEQLFILFRAAERPTLREINEAILRRDDLRGTASTETIRRMLHGSVPPHWTTVEAVMVALCGLADINPDAPGTDPFQRRPSEEWGDSTWRERIEFCWHRALDAPPSGEIPGRAAQ
jgi:hypothetical protein